MSTHEILDLAEWQERKHLQVDVDHLIGSVDEKLIQLERTEQVRVEPDRIARTLAQFLATRCGHDRKRDTEHGLLATRIIRSQFCYELVACFYVSGLIASSNLISFVVLVVLF